MSPGHLEPDTFRTLIPDSHLANQSFLQSPHLSKWQPHSFIPSGHKHLYHDRISPDPCPIHHRLLAPGSRASVEHPVMSDTSTSVPGPATRLSPGHEHQHPNSPPALARAWGVSAKQQEESFEKCRSAQNHPESSHLRVGVQRTTGPQQSSWGHFMTLFLWLVVLQDSSPPIRP